MHAQCTLACPSCDGNSHIPDVTVASVYLINFYNAQLVWTTRLTPGVPSQKQQEYHTVNNPKCDLQAISVFMDPLKNFKMALFWQNYQCAQNGHIILQIDVSDQRDG